MQKEQLLPRLLTNHYEPEETVIDGEWEREGQERKEGVDAALFQN